MKYRLIPWLLLAALAPAWAQDGPALVRIEGQVIDEVSRQPLPEAEVVLTPIGGPGTGARLLRTVSDSDGRFAFDTPRGRYFLGARLEGYLPPSPPAMSRGFDVAPDSSSLGHVISLMKGATISGRVLGPDGKPRPGLVVNALARRVAADGRVVTSMGQPGRILADGSFEFPYLDAAEYVIAAKSNGRGPLARLADGRLAEAPTFYPGTPDVNAAEAIRLRPGDAITGIDFAIGPAEAFEMSGTVVDAAGAPVRYAMVTVGYGRSDAGSGPGGFHQTFSEADGRFRLTDLTTGVYMLTVVSAVPRPAGSRSDVITIAPDGTSLEVMPGAARAQVNVPVEGRDARDVRVVLKR